MKAISAGGRQMHQVVEDVVADEGAGAHRELGRQLFGAKRSDQGSYRQRGEVGCRPARDYGLVDGARAVVVRVLRVLHVDGYSLHAKYGAVARLSDAQDDFRLRARDRGFQRRQRARVRGRQLRSNHVNRADPRRQPPHRFERRVDAFAAERFEAGDQGSHEG